MQQHFNPVDYGFQWTDDWYEWDRDAGHAAARAARAARAKELKARGIRPRLTSIPNQLVSRGGIGSGRPHVEFVATCYILCYE